MAAEKSRYRFRHRVGDILLVISAGYIGLALTWVGALFQIWPPYDIAVAFCVVFLAWWIGDYRHRWWPQVMVRDATHEVTINASEGAQPSAPPGAPRDEEESPEKATSEPVDRAPGSFVYSMLGGLAFVAVLFFSFTSGGDVGAGKLQFLMGAFAPVTLLIAVMLATFAYWGIVIVAHRYFPVRQSRPAAPFFAAVVALGFLWGVAPMVLMTNAEKTSFRELAAVVLYFAFIFAPLGVATAIPFWWLNRKYSPEA